MYDLTGHARLAGVVGWPVTHSRSPRLHGFWLRRLGIDGAYVPLPVPPERFEQAIRGIAAAGFRGVNVTLPHKLAALALCDEVDAFARRAGAVNTLVFDDGRILGSNTDGYGFLANLRAHDLDPRAGPALILGAGGAGRAIAAALQAEGVPVTLANRHLARAEAVAADLPQADGQHPVIAAGWQQIADLLPRHALLVNATSLGMTGQPRLPLNLAPARADLAVADIVYVPERTALLQDAQARGLRTVGGLGMLLHQAVPGFAAWFGVTPVVDRALHDHVLAALVPPAR
jgi:shikimate dehydrogenase